MRSRYMLSEYENVKAGRPLRFPDQFQGAGSVVGKFVSCSKSGPLSVILSRAAGSYLNGYLLSLEHTSPPLSLSDFKWLHLFPPAFIFSDKPPRDRQHGRPPRLPRRLQPDHDTRHAHEGQQRHDRHADRRGSAAGRLWSPSHERRQGAAAGLSHGRCHGWYDAVDYGNTNWESISWNAY